MYVTIIVPIIINLTGIFSGKYEDDFESTLSPENTISTDGPTEGDNAADSANLAQNHGDSNDADTCRSGDETACSEGARSDFDESAGSGGEGEEEDDTLTLSFQDISALRRSLEQDKMIRESLANERNNTTSNVRGRLA